MRSALPRARTPRLVARSVALAAVAALGLAGLPAVAYADDGSVTVVSTDNVAGASTLNASTSTVVISTTSSFAYAPPAVAPTITFTRNGTGTAGAAGSDTITAQITSDPPLTGTTKTFTLSVPVTSANPGTYDIKVHGTVPTAQDDTCTGCFTVHSSAPVSISGISPTAVAKGASVTLTVSGAGFARGNYTPSPNSNYACAACTAAPVLQIRAHGSGSPAAGFSFSDPLNAQNQQVAVPATATSITKVVTASGAVDPGTYDVYVQNTDAPDSGSSYTLGNALTVAPPLTIDSDARCAETAAPASPASTKPTTRQRRAENTLGM